MACLSSSPPPMLPEDDVEEEEDSLADGFADLSESDTTSYDPTGLSDKLHSIPQEAMQMTPKEFQMSDPIDGNVGIRLNGLGIPQSNDVDEIPELDNDSEEDQKSVDIHCDEFSNCESDFKISNSSPDLAAASEKMNIFTSDGRIENFQSLNGLCDSSPDELNFFNNNTKNAVTFENPPKSTGPNDTDLFSSEFRSFSPIKMHSDLIVSVGSGNFDSNIDDFSLCDFPSDDITKSDLVLPVFVESAENDFFEMQNCDFPPIKNSLEIPSDSACSNTDSVIVMQDTVIVASDIGHDDIQQIICDQTTLESLKDDENDKDADASDDFGDFANFETAGWIQPKEPIQIFSENVAIESVPPVEDDDDFGDFDSADFVGPSSINSQSIYTLLRPRITSVILDLFATHPSANCDHIHSKVLDLNPSEDDNGDTIWTKIDEIETTPALQMVWSKTTSQSHLMNLLKIDPRNIVLETKPRKATSGVVPPFAMGLSTANVLQPVKVETITSAAMTTKTTRNVQTKNQDAKEIVPPVTIDGLKNPLQQNGVHSVSRPSTPTREGYKEKRSTTNLHHGPVTSASKSRSREATIILDSFPLLNFIQAQTLTMPMSNGGQ